MELSPKNIPIELHQKWALAIGNFIIAFGNIESTLTEIIRLSALPEQIRVLTSLNFGRKAELVKAVLDDWNPLDIESIKEAFDKLRTITKNRNIVAHNGFSIALFEPLEGGEYFYEIGMANSRDSKYELLQIEDLQHDTETLSLIDGNLISWIQKDRVKNLF
jgi:hypothetical protein